MSTPVTLTLSPYVPMTPTPLPTRYFTLSKNFKPNQVKVENLERLNGQSNYEEWALQMSMVFRAMRVYDIVVEGVRPVSYATEEECESYEALSDQALLILIQVLSNPILQKVSKYTNPHEIWRYLKQTFYRDNTFSFIYQVASLCRLCTELDQDKTKSVTEFMYRFDDQ